MNKVLSKINRYDEVEFHEGDFINIVLPSQSLDSLDEPELEPMHVNGFYEIEVKSYMTQPASRTFDFMLKFNDNMPMPQCKMRGQVISETRGMFYMSLSCPETYELWAGWVIKSAIKNYKKFHKTC